MKPWRVFEDLQTNNTRVPRGCGRGPEWRLPRLARRPRVRPLQNDLGGAGQGQHNDPHWPSPVEVRERERDTHIDEEDDAGV